MPQRQISEKRAAYLKNDYDRGFIKFCRFKAAHAQWGTFRSNLKIEEDHRQQDGFIHAGVMATMADHTAGYSAFTTVPENMQILTIEFKINFLRPAFGEELVCNSRGHQGGTPDHRVGVRSLGYTGRRSGSRSQGHGDADGRAARKT